MQINIGQYILAQANFPDKIALEDSCRTLTYHELLQRSMRLSDELEQAGIKNKDPVIILIPKSVDAVIGIVATTFCGGVYVPVDINSPIERLKAIFQKLGGAFIVCSEATLSIASQLESDKKRIVCLRSDNHRKNPDEDMQKLRARALGRIKNVIDQDPCYVIFTSGTTGVPKGVTISHRSVIDYIDWARSYYPIRKQHRLASQAPFYFDNSTLDLYLAFSTGASLHLPPEKIFYFPKMTIEYLNTKKITTVFWVPSVIVAIANSGILEKVRPKYLKHVLFAGEQMPVPQINTWVRALPGVLFSNLYGPTEITVDCTAYTFFDIYEGDLLPIGHPCRNTDVLILNDTGKECEVGELGELYVRGTSLSLGYWNDREKTNEAFVQNPLESRFRDIVYRTGDLVKKDDFGCIFFVGRRDSQVKVNGYRIELGEIEANSSKVAGIARSVAVFDKKKSAIVLFVQPMDDVVIEIGALRHELRKFLPKYMMPNKILIVSTFPLNRSGKIDRLKLTKGLETEV